MTVRRGGCLCGSVRYKVRGEPLRVGLCHCSDCRKESGSVFVCFAVYPSEAFVCSGDVKVFQGRAFCPICGGRVFNPGSPEMEIRVGSLDDPPSGLRPSYEIWTVRREHWLPDLDVPKFDGDRFAPDRT